MNYREEIIQYKYISYAWRDLSHFLGTLFSEFVIIYCYDGNKTLDLTKNIRDIKFRWSVSELSICVRDELDSDIKTYLDDVLPVLYGTEYGVEIFVRVTFAVKDKLMYIIPLRKKRSFVSKYSNFIRKLTPPWKI